MAASEVRVPPLGESVVEATLGAWLKREGDAVRAGEPLVQLETEKVNLDVSAERDGVLQSVARQEGDTVQPGDVLALLGEAVSDGRAPSSAPAPAAASISESAPPPAPPAAPLDRPHASPVARRMAEDHGIDLVQVSGSGTAGRVTRGDVEQYLQDARPPATRADTPSTPALQPSGSTATDAEGSSVALAPSGAGTTPDPRGEERQRMSRRRLTIAQRLLEAQRTAAMLTTFNEVDMSAVIDLRGRRKEQFKERYGVGLGFMSFFTRAAVAALKAFPRLNAEIQGSEVVLKRYYDIGIAVGADEGLVVPVVRDADRRNFAEIEAEIARLAERARTNTLALEDLRGGTFTITNGGVYGSLLSTPILSPPQVGILGMHTIQQRPVVRDGQVIARPMMYLALTYDHRLVDGREAVQFLARVKELIEDPEALLFAG